MAINLFLVILIIIILIVIWVFYGLKELKHKSGTFFLIALILFLSFSLYFVFKGKDLTISNFSDLGRLGNLYFAWLGTVFDNIKTVTTEAIKMNWQTNQTA
jgi:purine-cytosine permease-like protein